MSPCPPRRLHAWPLRLVLGLVLLSLACARATLPTATPDDSTVLYSDDFLAEDARWDLFDDGTLSARYASGQLLLVVNSTDELTWSLLGAGLVGTRQFDDFALAVDATALAGPANNSYGLVFRYVDPYNFYSFDASSSGWYRIRARQGTAAGATQRELVPWTQSAALRTGVPQTNRLGVIARGSQLTFLINDQAVNQVVDASYPRGQIGVIAGSFAEGGVQIAFDNLLVSKP